VLEGREKTDKNDDARPSLQIILVTNAEPGPPVRERLLSVARQAVDFDRTKGDTITLSVDPILGQVPREPVNVSQPPRTTVAPAGQTFSMPQVPLWPLAVAIAALIGLFLFSRFRRPSQPLSLTQREAFSSRLKSLLDEEIAHGKTPA
jgi:hypothetical protein